MARNQRGQADAQRRADLACRLEQAPTGRLLGLGEEVGHEDVAYSDCPFASALLASFVVHANIHTDAGRRRR